MDEDGYLLEYLFTNFFVLLISKMLTFNILLLKVSTKIYFYFCLNTKMSAYEESIYFSLPHISTTDCRTLEAVRKPACEHANASNSTPVRCFQKTMNFGPLVIPPIFLPALTTPSGNLPPNFCIGVNVPFAAAFSLALNILSNANR